VDHHFSWFSAFLLGLLGSGHCLGMCGPLVLILGGSRKKSGNLWLRHGLYHLGRTNTYMLIGGVLSGLGAVMSKAEEALFLTTWVQMGLSLLASGFLIWFGLTRLGFFTAPASLSHASLAQLPGLGKVQQWMVEIEGPLGAYLKGLVFGFLPCGLSYGAFAMAVPLGHPLEGAMTLLAFGLGTVPALMLLALAASRIQPAQQKWFELVSGGVMVVYGIYQILRLVDYW
jgi:hypothetical protein